MTLSAGGHIKVNEYPCEIDPSESYLKAHINEDGISWELKIQAKDSEEFWGENEDPNVPYAAPSLYIFFRNENLSDWRQLSGFETKIVSPEEPTLLPDNPSGAYLGYHIFPNNHTIHIGKNDGTLFEVEWTCEGREFESAELEKFSVKAIVRFDGVLIHFDEEFHLAMERFRTAEGREIETEEIDRMSSEWKADKKAAELRLAKYFKLQDFGEPERWNWSLMYPALGSNK